MNFFKWPPGPLLTPPPSLNVNTDARCRFACTCRWPSAAKQDISILCAVFVDDGVVFTDIHHKPLLMKRFIFMNEEKFISHWDGKSPGTEIVTLPRRHNLLDDYDIDILFTSGTELQSFLNHVNRSPAHEPQLWTNIYRVTDDSSEFSDSSDSSSKSSSDASNSPSDASNSSSDASNSSGASNSSDDAFNSSNSSSNPSNSPSDSYHSRASSFSDGVTPARLLRFHALHEVVNEVLTAFAYGDGGQIFGPIITWDASLENIDRDRIVRSVQKEFQQEPPPLVLILDGRASHVQSPIPDLIMWDDEKTVALTPLISLPSPPTWEGASPAPQSWVGNPFENYGIHERKSMDGPDHNPRFIALSHELVDYFAAAHAALIDATPANKLAAENSVTAATASVKATVVHELAHLWVSKWRRHSPSRKNVQGVEDASFDCTEDPLCPGQIEAGLFVERCWLGAPHELTLNRDGWLSFALLESPFEAQLDTQTDATQTEEDWDNFTPSPQLGSPFQLKQFFYAPGLDSDSDSEEGEDSENFLGRLFEVRDQTPSPTIQSGPDTIELIVNVRICDPAVVAPFVESRLPCFPRGELATSSFSTSVSPARRNRNRTFSSPIIRSTSQTPPPTVRAPDPSPPLLLGSTGATALRGKGLKWPPVIHRDRRREAAGMKEVVERSRQ
ncbi:hypothetical protein MSAN_00079300 [Mycena sanguinolenta]|uniref:Uncharacterized protein n=1 Tax=Mycena sanguinolenta TaxID=230812 RepID=A0A8H6ZJE6_9AGAR|nr:hypothetical protein MSAN_00079300 [Mycena sanguinolenta]